MNILGIDCSYSKLGKTRGLLNEAKPDLILELTGNNTSFVIKETLSTILNMRLQKY